MVIAELQVSESPIQIAETQTCFIPPPCSVCQEFPGTKTGQCIAKFKYTLMTTNRSAYTQYMTDFAMDRRNVWDCCEGSSAKWMNDVYCGVYNSYEGACTNQTGEDMQLACSHLQIRGQSQAYPWRGIWILCVCTPHRGWVRFLSSSPSPISLSVHDPITSCSHRRS